MRWDKPPPSSYMHSHWVFVVSTMTFTSPDNDSTPATPPRSPRSPPAHLVRGSVPALRCACCDRDGWATLDDAAAAAAARANRRIATPPRPRVPTRQAPPPSFPASASLQNASASGHTFPVQELGPPPQKKNVLCIHLPFVVICSTAAGEEDQPSPSPRTKSGGLAGLAVLRRAARADPNERPARQPTRQTARTW